MQMNLANNTLSTRPIPHALRALFYPYRAKDRLGRDGYFLTPKQLDDMLAEVLAKITGGLSEVDFSELVTTLLQLRRLQSEQERAEALLQKFLIHQYQQQPVTEIRLYSSVRW
jgi:hypothetical protein